MAYELGSFRLGDGEELRKILDQGGCLVEYHKGPDDWMCHKGPDEWMWLWCEVTPTGYNQYMRLGWGCNLGTIDEVFNAMSWHPERWAVCSELRGNQT